MGSPRPHASARLAAAALVAATMAGAAPAEGTPPEGQGAGGEPAADGAGESDGAGEPAPEGWVRVRSELGGFSVLVPRRHRQVVAEREDEGGPTRGFAIVATRPVAFGGRALYTARCLLYSGPPPTPAEVFEDATADYDALGYLAWRRDRSLGEHPGIEFLVRDQRRLSYGLIYHLGARVCTLSVESPRAGGPGEEEVARFWDSFEISEP